MQTLTPTTTIRWIKRLTEIRAAIERFEALPNVPIDVWRPLWNAKISAGVMEDELLQLVVAPVEVEPAQ